jgi:hypothetical protein
MHGRRRALAIGAALLSVLGLVAWQGITEAAAPADAPVAFASNPSGKGYWVVYDDGRVRGFGNARPYGGTQTRKLRRPIVAMAATPSGHGYWLVAADGGVFTFGDAKFVGSIGGVRLNKPIVGIARTRTGRGYWLVAQDGGVFSFGDARFRGSAAVLRLRSPITDIASTRTDEGYWLVAQDGGVFTFGDAKYHGSAAGKTLSPITTISPSNRGRGYFLVSQDARVRAYGAAQYTSNSVRAHMLVGFARRGDGSWSVLTANGAPVRFREFFRASDNAPGTTPPSPSPTPPAPTGPPATAPPPTPAPTSPPPTNAPPDNPPPTHLSGNIIDYVKLAGDQLVTVPNGTYQAGAVTAPHAATNGRYKGWLVLRAQSKLGVTVDLGGRALTLEGATSRVLFIGFRFVNGPIYVNGNNIAFWYTDHTYPADVWARQGRTHSSADTVHAYAPSTSNVSFYGSDVHDTGDAFDVSKSENLRLQGVKIWNLSDMDMDPQDRIHEDAIDGVSGGSTGLTVRDSWIKGRIMMQDYPGHDGAPHTGMRFENTWVSNSPSGGFTFTSTKPTAPRGLFGTRVNIRSWGHHNGLDRLDIIDGRHIPQPNTQPSRVNVVDSGITRSAPPAGMASPPDVWRGAHGYDSWAAELF